MVSIKQIYCFFALLIPHYCISIFIDINSTVECSNNNNNNCSIVCDDNEDSCRSQYILGYNNIHCENSNSCNGMIVFCPTTKCNIYCSSWHSCDDAIIFANKTKEVNIVCGYKTSCRGITIHLSSTKLYDGTETQNRALITCSSPIGVGHAVHNMEVCDSAVIWANFIDELILKCNACDGIIVHGENAKHISISSIPISTASWEPRTYSHFYPSFRNAIIYATKTAELFINCTGIFDEGYRSFGYVDDDSSYACVQNSFYVSSYSANIYCSSYGCSDNNLYLPFTENINVSKIVTVNYCDRCDFSTDCIDHDVWNIYCNHDDRSVVFDGSVCVDNDNISNNCCYEGLFNIMVEYNDCFIFDGDNPNSNVAFFVVGILLTLILLAPCLVMTIYWFVHLKKTQIYKKYSIPFKKPSFILKFTLISDIMVHLSIIYGFIYFIAFTINLRVFCQGKYGWSTLIVGKNIHPVSLCDDDYFCRWKCEHWFSAQLCFCGIDEGVLGLAVLYGLLFGLYVVFELYVWKNKRMDCINHSFCLMIKKEWNQINIYPYNTRMLFRHNRFILIVLINKIILLILIIFQIIFYGVYTHLFPFIVVFIMVVITHILGVYYLRLPYYRDTDTIKLILIIHYDIDIGNIILSYMGIPKMRQKEISTKNHTELQRFV